MKLSKFRQTRLGKNLLTICCLLAAVICLGTEPKASCQNTEQGALSSLSPAHESLTSDLTLLENRLKLNIPFNQPISERIGSLEMIIFGSPQSGSFLERLNRIKKAVPLSEPQSSAFPAQTHNQVWPPAAADGLGPPASTQMWFPAPPEVAVPNRPTSQEQPLLPKAPSINSANPIAAKLFQMTPLLSESSVNFVRIESAGTNPNQAGDYLDVIMKATKDKVVRFKQTPIPVYITPFSDPAFTKACVRAFEAWEERAGGLVSFRQEDNPHHARIRVIWSNLGLAQDPHDCSLGAHTLTRWRRTSSGMQIMFIGGMPVPLKLNNGTYDVPPQVIEVNLDLISAKPEEVRMRLLQNIVAHELGHALGILGHSPSHSDLMYPVTDECSRLSQADINTLTRLYHKKVDIPL